MFTKAYGFHQQLTNLGRKEEGTFELMEVNFFIHRIIRKIFFRASPYFLIN